MSKYPTIPDFNGDPQSLSTTLRTVKQTLEIMAGQRQGEDLGAPSVYVQVKTPNQALRSTYKVGDLWINLSTGKINFWTGNVWQQLS